MSGIIGGNLGRSSGLVKSAAVSAGMTLVHSTDVSSGVANVTMDNIFTSTYKVYLIQGFDIVNAATAAGSFRVIDTAGNTDGGSNYSQVRQYADHSGGTATVDCSASASQMMMQENGAVDNLTGSFWGFFTNPLSTSHAKHFYGESCSQTGAHVHYTRFCNVWETTGTGCRGLVYQANFGISVNVDHAYLRVYGLTES